MRPYDSENLVINIASEQKKEVLAPTQLYIFTCNKQDAFSKVQTAFTHVSVALWTIHFNITAELTVSLPVVSIETS